MTFNMDGKQTVYVQTVDRGKINGMSQREWNNAIRILKQDPNAILIAVPKGSIPSLGSLDISTMETGKVNIIK